MTFTGKLSRGCSNCRKVHTKCDEQRPHCSRCIRLGKICNGYRDENDLIFRSSSAKLISASRSRPLKGSEMSEQHFAKGTSHDRTEWYSVGRSLSSSENDQAVCYFYETTIHTTSKLEHSRYLHFQLPKLLGKCLQDSVLALATQAIANAVWAKSGGYQPRALRISRKSYIRAVAALRAAIHDPAQRASDEVLYAVLLLGGYETIAFNNEDRSAWGSHVDGAAALLRIRGRGYLSSPLQCKLFLFIRRNACQSQAQLLQPVDDVFQELADTVHPHENFEDKLLSWTSKIPRLQSLAREMFLRPSWGISGDEIRELIKSAESIDGELVDWARHVPVDWTYSISRNINCASDPNFGASLYMPSSIHTYPDYYIARVWNIYRTSRIILQSIILRAEERLYSDTTQTEKILNGLIDDICASVPFLLGYDVSQLRRSRLSHGSIWPRGSRQIVDSSKPTGRFSLVWPLYLACGVACIVDAQRNWMRAQLQLIGEDGEPHAKYVAEARSQTLLGTPETFRFDCV